MKAVLPSGRANEATAPRNNANPGINAVQQTKGELVTDAAHQRQSQEQLRLQCERLLNDLHAAHLQSEAYFSQLDGKRVELAEAQHAVVAHEHRAAELRERLQWQATELTHRRSEVQAQIELNGSLRLDLENSRLQIRQLNADLAVIGALLQSSKGEREREIEVSTQILAVWQRSQVSAIAVDLRQPIVGENWYLAEADGRWTGPSSVSQLSLPALGAGRYVVAIDIVGSMTPAILAGLIVKINDQTIHCKRSGRKHPYVVTGHYQASDVPVELSCWTMEFRVPSVVSPADKGSNDQRQLGVRIGQVRISRDS